MKYLFAIVLMIFGLQLFAEQPDYSIKKAFWNIETNTLDVIICSDDRSIEELYSKFDQFSLTVDGSTNFEMSAISKGLNNLNEDKATIPNKILIAIDQGELNDSIHLLNNYIQLASEIITKHPNNVVFELRLVSSYTSVSKRVTKYNLLPTVKHLMETIRVGEPTQFRRLFRSTDFNEYKKFFLLTNGLSGEFNRSNSSFKDIIDTDQLESTQIIPVSKQAIFNYDFFEYLDHLNQRSVSRPDFSFIPKGDMTRSSLPLSTKTLLISYIQNVEKTIQNKKTQIALNFEDGDVEVNKSIQTILRPFTSTIVNTKSEKLFASFKRVLFVGSLLSLLLYYLIPIYNRISFKRNCVFTYGEVKKEGLHKTDPLKMTKIQDQDTVVTVGEQVMLLESWKYIKENMSNPKFAKEYKHFFDLDIKENIFIRQAGVFKFVLPIWLAAVGSLCSGLIYLGLTRVALYKILVLEITNIDLNSAVTELPVLSNVSILGTMCLVSAICIGAIKWSYDKSFKISKFLVNTVIACSIAFTGLLAVVYIVVNNENSIPLNVIFVCGVAIFSSLMFDKVNRNSLRGILFNSVQISVASVLLYFVFTSNIITSQLNDNLVFLLFNFTIFSIILCWYVYQQKQEILSLGLKIESPIEIDNDIYHLEQHFQNELKEEFSIGKSPEADLYIKWPDVDIKEDHAVIEREHNQFIIKPKEGTVYINQQEVIEKAVITANDEIKLSEGSISQFTIIKL